MLPYSSVLLALAAVAAPNAAPNNEATGPIRPSLAFFAQETKPGPAAKPGADKQDDKQTAMAVCRPALVAMARYESGQGEPGATPTKIYRVTRDDEWVVESERPLTKPASILLVDPQWSPCLGTATRQVALRSRKNRDSRVDAMVVEGCPAPPDRNTITAIEGVSDGEISTIAGPDDGKRKVDWFALRDLKHLNRLGRLCATPVKPFDVKQRITSRKDAAVRAALATAKRRRDLDGLQAKLLVTRGKRRYVIFASDDNTKPVKVVAVAGRRAAVAGTWPDLWPR